jgi:hypothetical protein
MDEYKCDYINMNGYKCFYKGKSIIIYHNTPYEAQLLAQKIFKARKVWEVSVALCEVNGKQSLHTAD